MRKADFLFGLIVLILGFFASCAPHTKGFYKITTISNDEVLGTVQVEFTSRAGTFANGGWFIAINDTVKQEAYLILKEKAASQYQGNIDVVNIEIVHIKGGRSIFSNEAIFNTRGNVISLEGNTLAKAADQMIASFRPNSKIAILYITSNDVNTTEFITNGLEDIMINNGFNVIDKNQLDRIRREQNFQLSGYIDDETAISIGKTVGADIIVTGSVTGTGSARRLRLRALNTQTTQVMSAVSEHF
jgi:hypothetical protein